MKPPALKAAGWSFLAAMLILHALLVWDLRDFIPKGYADFTIFYSAGKIMRDGPRVDLYDGASQFAVQKEFAPGVRIRQAALPYNHPPFEALLFVPLTSFPYFDAYLIWNLFNVFILCAIPFILRSHVAILRTHPQWFWTLLSLAFFPVFMTLIQGQDSILLLLLFVLTFVFLKKNAVFIAGSCLALGLFRFHLVLPLALILLLRGKRNVILGFISVALLLLLLSVGLVGWSTVMHYPEYVVHLEAAGAGGGIFPGNMPTVHGLLAPFIGVSMGKLTGGLIIGLLSLVLLVIAAVYWPKRSVRTDFDLQFSFVLVITVLVSYHAYAHDLSLLLLPLLLVANHVQSTSASFARGKLALLGPMFLLFWSPLYIVLRFRYAHLNLLALALLWWTWGLWREISRLQPVEPISRSLEFRGES